MRLIGRRCCGIAVVACALLLMVARAGATTVVPMDERDLAAVSAGAVIGRVESVTSLRAPGSNAIYTDVAIRLSEVVFGQIPDDVLVLRELGGRVGGTRQWIDGSPEYRVDEHVLVFINPRPDGTLRTTALGMGKYRIEADGSSLRARRQMGLRTTVLDARTGEPVDAPRDDILLRQLVRRIRRAAPVAPTAPLRLRPPAMVGAAPVSRSAFTLLRPFSRWFEPDDGVPITYKVDPLGDATLGPAVSIAAVHAAMAAWTAIAASPLELRHVGDAGPAPFPGCPDESRILFNDPFGEFDNPLDCRGTLAVGGGCETAETREVNGVTFQRIVTGKVWFNDGWGDCPFWTGCNLSEIATHEIGHSLGLGHSKDDAAIMAVEAHLDGRCASLGADDEAAIAFVYPIPPTVTPTPTYTPSPAPTSTTTRTGTITRTPSRTATPTRTATSTRTGTATRTRPIARTPTAPIPTNTRSHTASPTPTRTQASTPSATRTPTAPPLAGSWLDLILNALRHVLSGSGGRL